MGEMNNTLVDYCWKADRLDIATDEAHSSYQYTTFTAVLLSHHNLTLRNNIAAAFERFEMEWSS